MKTKHKRNLIVGYATLARVLGTGRFRLAAAALRTHARISFRPQEAPEYHHRNGANHYRQPFREKPERVMENLWRHRRDLSKARCRPCSKPPTATQPRTNYSGINGVLLAMQAQLKSDESAWKLFHFGKTRLRRLQINHECSCKTSRMRALS